MMTCYKLLLVLGVIISVCALDVDDPTLITLPEGQIRGQALQSPNNNTYYAFQEIPYAAPPVGKLRFQSPVAPEKWEGVLDATENKKICYQTTYGNEVSGLTQTEDCLYLNVFTPVKPGSSADTPVLVWIHGGAYMNGAGNVLMYKPELFIDQDIVVVMLNYRLGTLGFLTTEDGVVPGNLGLRDQNFALQWIKRNIDLFGGDPEKVTIAGESAGGSSVGLQLLSPKSAGLFRGAILQSGTSLCQWSHQNYARSYAFELGRSLDAEFTSDDSEDLLNLLQSVPASDINNNTIAADIGKETGLIRGSGVIWLPVIEDDAVEDPFLTGPFHKDLRTGNINRVPIIVGFNSEEYITFMISDPSVPLARAKYLDNDLSNLIRYKFNMTEENKLIAGTKLRKIYTDGLFQDDIGNVVKFFSDESFTTPIVRHAQLQSNYTDVYLYQFSYKGKMGGLFDAEVSGLKGVGHGEDLQYLWDSYFLYSGPDYNAEDLKIRQRLLKLWSNFVKFLDPTPQEDSLLDNVTWEKVSPDNLVYLNINDTLEMQKNPKEYIKWEEIIDAYAIPPLVNY